MGERPAPMEWIKTWAEKNPDWEQRFWGNEEVFGIDEMDGIKKWWNFDHINYYREKKIWQGVADVVRYEILYRYGGFMPGADSVCLEPIDELFADESADAFTCYENETLRGDLVSPLLACTPKNPLASALIEVLGRKENLGIPWKSTGNLFMMHSLKALEYPHIKIFPSHTLLPIHHTGLKYEGKGKVYAEHKWGTGRDAYSQLEKSKI